MTNELELARGLIRIPSRSGREAEVMAFFAEALKGLGFDEVRQDEAGNTIGRYDFGDGPTLMMNGHLDTVPLGDPDQWAHGPLSAELVEGRIWGRGAVDMKSALAAMAFAAKDVAERSAEDGLGGSLLVAAVVQEEVGGLGARHLAGELEPDVVILGEPSALKLMLGHRGRVEIEARIPGKIAHAARNELGDNALYRTAELLGRLEALDLPREGILGGSSLTPTQLSTFPVGGANVVPGEARLTIDYRNIPGDDVETILDRLQRLAPAVEFSIPTEHAQSQNGAVSIDFPRVMPPYLAPGENSYVSLARKVLQSCLPELGYAFEESTWWFGTDAPYLSAKGAVVIGIGPGEAALAHTTQESIAADELKAARTVYGELAKAYLKGGAHER